MKLRTDPIPGSQGSKSEIPDFGLPAENLDSERDRKELEENQACIAWISPDSARRRNEIQEKLVIMGCDSISDHELLELIMSKSDYVRDDAPLIAERLITRFGSFANVISAPRSALTEESRLEFNEVAALKAVQAAVARVLRNEILEQPLLNRWDRVMDYLTAVMAREKIEQFRILFLDSKNRLLADEAQTRGTVNHTPVYPREVVKRALELHATALILVHNHPSGDPTPSRADIEMTREVKTAAAVLSISLHDHVIVGNGRWLSFRAEGLLQRAVEKRLPESATVRFSVPSGGGLTMRGADRQTAALFSYVSPEALVPADHPLRAIRGLTNAAPERLSRDFDRLYGPGGRGSIAPEKSLRALLLQAFYSVRSERQLVQQITYNMLLRRFVGLSMDAPVWDVTVYTKNRYGLLAGDMAQRFFAAVLADPAVKPLLSSEHFSVDGTLLDAWASIKSFRPKDGGGAPPAPGRNGDRDFHGEKRSNETHASTTDPDARLARKSNGHAAKLCYAGHVAMENRNCSC